MFKKFHGLLKSQEKNLVTVKEHFVVLNIMTVLRSTQHWDDLYRTSSKSSRHRCLHNGIANFSQFRFKKHFLLLSFSLIFYPHISSRKFSQKYISVVKLKTKRTQSKETVFISSISISCVCWEKQKSSDDGLCVSSSWKEFVIFSYEHRQPAVQLIFISWVSLYWEGKKWYRNLKTKKKIEKKIFHFSCQLPSASEHMNMLPTIV